MSANFLDNLYDKKQVILNDAMSNLAKDDLFPVIGVELEFYLLDQKKSPIRDPNQIKLFINKLQNNFHFQNLTKNNIYQEQGVGQIEFKTAPYKIYNQFAKDFSSHINKLCTDFILAKKVIHETADEFGFYVEFTAQPFRDDCGSALQINLNLVNQNDQNIFDQKNNSLIFAINGILKLMNNLIIFAAPNESDYLRYNYDLNQKLFKNGKYSAPINIGWGHDNRTAAIRVPKSNSNYLEYRLPAADADITLNIAALLMAVKWGIDNKINDFPAIYGNAFDNQYGLTKLIANYQLAYENLISSSNPLLEKLKSY